MWYITDLFSFQFHPHVVDILLELLALELPISTSTKKVRLLSLSDLTHCELRGAILMPLNVVFVGREPGLDRARKLVYIQVKLPDYD